MAFFLTIVGGSDDGRAFEVEGAQALIGRSGSADVKLNDDTVSWEHCTIREEEGRFLVENLSSLGTKVRGQDITRPTRVAPGEEIELSARCRVKAEVTALSGDGEKSASTPIIAGVAFLVLLVLGVGVYLGVRPAATSGFQITDANWRDGYNRLSSQLEDWQRQGYVTPGFVQLFEDAWFTDITGSREAARIKWNLVVQDLRTMPAPAVSTEVRGQTFREFTASEWEGTRHLGGLMRLPPPDFTPQDADDADTPSGRIKALVGFAEYRAWLNAQEEE